MKYRKKPVVVEAVTVRSAISAAIHDWQKLPDWLRHAYERNEIVFASTSIFIMTAEGAMTASADDYIIKGIAGEIYPCKPDIFAATYEPAEAGEQ